MGPRGMLTADTTDQTPIARGRSSSSKMTGSTPSVIGMMIAPPRPMKARKPITLPAD